MALLPRCPPPSRGKPAAGQVWWHLLPIGLASVDQFSAALNYLRCGEACAGRRSSAFAGRPRTLPAKYRYSARSLGFGVNNDSGRSSDTRVRPENPEFCNAKVSTGQLHDWGLV